MQYSDIQIVIITKFEGWAQDYGNSNIFETLV